MGRSVFGKLVSGVLLMVFPGALFAADSGAAMLYTNGPAWVNGSHVPRASSAIFSGDLLQTPSDSVANINEPGSAITVESDSLVKFEGSSVRIEHGGVRVSTSKGMGSSAGDVKIAPASSSWTEFNVTDVDGKVNILAKKGDLTVNYGKEVFTIAQGQETSRDEDSPETKQKKKKSQEDAGAAPAAGGGLLNSPIAVGIGAGAIIGVTTWVLLQNQNPASPSHP
jgi:hypothetical protein